MCLLGVGEAGAARNQKRQAGGQLAAARRREKHSGWPPHLHHEVCFPLLDRCQLSVGGLLITPLHIAGVPVNILALLPPVTEQGRWARSGGCGRAWGRVWKPCQQATAGPLTDLPVRAWTECPR